MEKQVWYENKDKGVPCDNTECEPTVLACTVMKVKWAFWEDFELHWSTQPEILEIQEISGLTVVKGMEPITGLKHVYWCWTNAFTNATTTDVCI